MSLSVCGLSPGLARARSNRLPAQNAERLAAQNAEQRLAAQNAEQRLAGTRQQAVGPSGTRQPGAFAISDRHSGHVDTCDVRGIQYTDARLDDGPLGEGDKHFCRGLTHS